MSKGWEYNVPLWDVSQFHMLFSLSEERTFSSVKYYSIVVHPFFFREACQYSGLYLVLQAKVKAADTKTMCGVECKQH